MSPLSYVLLFVAAFGAGVLNSVAGGGILLVFPTMLSIGVSPVAANASSTVALWPGTAASVVAYRREIGRGRSVPLLAAVGVAGGLLGAQLLVRAPASVFQTLVPYLLLVATGLFASSGWLTRLARRRAARASASAASSRPGESSGGPWATVGLLLVQLVIATYGGYFGAGIGFLLLAALAVTGMEDIHAMNGVKSVLVGCINGAAVATFVLAGVVVWSDALVALVGAAAGGYLGASVARRLDPLWVRRGVVALGFALTIYFFVRR